MANFDAWLQYLLPPSGAIAVTPNDGADLPMGADAGLTWVR